MSRSSDSGKLAVWRERLERFSRSGLTVGRFCAGEGVSSASFYNWRKRLNLKGGRRSATEGHAQLHASPTEGAARFLTRPTKGRGCFRQVGVVAGTPGAPSGAAELATAGLPSAPLLPTAPALCIQLPGGTRMEVGTGDLDALRVVIVEVARADRDAEAASC